MERAHIAFFIFPHAPFVHPALSIVQTLVRRGHRVTCVTSDRFAPKLGEIGAEVLTCPPFRNRVLEPGQDRWTEGSRSIGSDFVDLTTETLALVTGFYERNKPALIIYDRVSFGGRILAGRLKVPAIQTSPAFGFDRSHFGQQLRDPDFKKTVDADHDRINQLLEQHQISGDYPFHQEQLNIFYYPQALQLYGTSINATCFFASRCAGEQPCRLTWRRNSETTRPLALVSTSTYYVQGPDYFQLCTEALTGLGWHVVLAIGDNNIASSLGPLPPHFEVLQHVPQIQALPHADLLICLGGMITTVEAMYHGVPLLMITHGFPEPELYAENNQKLGLGRHLKKTDTTAENIRNEAVEIYHDTALRNNVRAMQRIVQRGPGGEETTNKILDYLELTSVS